MTNNNGNQTDWHAKKYENPKLCVGGGKKENATFSQ